MALENIDIDKLEASSILIASNSRVITRNVNQVQELNLTVRLQGNIFQRTGLFLEN